MKAFVLMWMLAASASAQPAGSSAAPARRPAWLTLGVGIGYRLEPTDDANWDYLGGSLRYYRPVGPGPLVVGVGASAANGFLFERGGLLEADVALGASASVGMMKSFIPLPPGAGRTHRGSVSRRTSRGKG